MIDIIEKQKPVSIHTVTHWVKVGIVSDFPQNIGVCVQYKNEQIAVFNFSRVGKWYASQNMCPHKMEMVLSRGLLGEEAGDPKISCPLHKNNFSLRDGSHLNGELPSLVIYPVKIENNNVFVGFE